jgi:phage baseplate assembly protein W
MESFTGKYTRNGFILSSDKDVLKAELVSILNTPIGSRFYYPTYGSNLNQLRFSILNHFTVNMIGQEVKSAIELLDGVTLNGISYYISNNTVNFVLDLSKYSENYKVSLSVSDGVAS